ncbi:hypothetical protein V2J09_019402 [Rumex salicifolius]
MGSLAVTTGSSVVLSSFRATLILTPKRLSLQILPNTQRILRLPRYHNYLLYSSSSPSAVAALETSSSAAQNCACPEWLTFIDRLKSRGYIVPTTTSSEDRDDVYKDMSVLKNACLSFARDRFDVFKSLSKDDVQALVASGCPNLNRKVVNSAKRLRAYTGLNEADVCGVCDLRGSCDRAYVTLQESESGARTVDIVRILIFYGLEQSANSQGVKSAAREQAELSAKRLLLELVELSESPPEPGLVKPSGIESYKKQPSEYVSVKKVPKNVGAEGTQGRNWTCTKCSFLNFSRNITCLQCSEPGPGDGADVKKGDWICPECKFMNFSRNADCLKCKAEGPKRVDMINLEMKKGDWNCPKCNYMNFSKNKTCYRCTELRPPRDLRPGEWECPSCDFLNFKRNVICKKCEFKPRKENAVQYDKVHR